MEHSISFVSMPAVERLHVEYGTLLRTQNVCTGNAWNRTSIRATDTTCGMNCTLLPTLKTNPLRLWMVTLHSLAHTMNFTPIFIMLTLATQPVLNIVYLWGAVKSPGMRVWSPQQGAATDECQQSTGSGWHLRVPHLYLQWICSPHLLQKTHHCLCTKEQVLLSEWLSVSCTNIGSHEGAWETHQKLHLLLHSQLHWPTAICLLIERVSIYQVLHTTLSHRDVKNRNYVRLLLIDYSSAYNTIVPHRLITKLRDLPQPPLCLDSSLPHRW